MADDNAPQPPARSGADKEKARQQSRPVSGPDATTSSDKTGGTGTKGSSSTKSTSTDKGGRAAAPGTAGRTAANGAGGRSSTKSSATRQGGTKGSGNRQVSTRPKSGAGSRAPAPRRSTTTLLTWGTVLLVLVVIVVLVIIKATGGSSNGNAGPTTFSPAPATVTSALSSVPDSVFNTVGVNSPTIPVQPPRAAPKNAPPLTFSVPATTGQGNGAAAASSTELPGVFYFGAEYCPYCAAERWPLIIALSRFGKFANLGTMESSAQDIDASTATFTFLRASLASPYVAFKAVEHQSNQIVGGSYSILQPLNAAEAKLVAKYDNSPSTASSAASSGSYPFVDFGNKWLTVGASYSPTALAGLTREQIASGLSDPTQPVTQAIISTANYQTAAICQITQDQPSSVCTSKGVTEAAKAMGIKS